MIRYYYLLLHTACKDNMKGCVEKRNLVLDISCDRDTRHSCVHLTHVCTYAQRDGPSWSVPPYEINYHPIPSKLPLMLAPVGLRCSREFPKKRKSFRDRHQHKRLRSACPRASWSNRSIENLSPRVSYT